VIFRHSRLLSRRRFVSLASIAGASLMVPAPGLAKSPDVTNLAPFIAQGETGGDSINNCGPATVAAAISYSGVASPSVEELRNALGFYGPTSTDQWSNLLNLYNVPWRATWSKNEMDRAIETGHVVIIAAWMADLSSASDFEEAWSLDLRQVGRYDGFPYGHSMLIVGSNDDRRNYQVHDPNVFRNEKFDWYSNGSPKGAYRRYRADEIWHTVRTYADGFGIAVAPPAPAAGPASPTADQVEASADDPLIGPAGGQPAQRNLIPATQFTRVPQILTNTLSPRTWRSTDGSARVK